MHEKASPARRAGRPRTIAHTQRRQAIVAAACEAFIELGFARTTTAEIAARAKVSKRAIYEVFETKTAMFAAVIQERQHLILDLPRPPDEQLSIPDTLTQIFRLDIDDEAEQAREAILNLLVRESILFPDLSDYLYDHEVIRSREALLDWLHHEIARGRLPAGDVFVYAGMLMDIVFGALLPRRRLKGPVERQQRTAHIQQRLAIFLRGILA